ncbi:MAG TPA: hypothetical protein VHQ47_05480 [Phycisphaerae bacterium]|nr:hypothetical protein [Phycisphaerae bacterium]
MQILLSQQVQNEIDHLVKSGCYQTPEEVIVAALASLQQQVRYGDFGPGELDALLAEGKKDIDAGRVMGLDEGFHELKRRHDQRQGGISE